MSERFDTFGVPNAGPDPYEQALESAEPVDESGELEPGEAAALLERSSRQARRALNISPLLLMLAGTPTILIGFGALWLSVRHQDPYAGPQGWAIGVLYGVLAVWFVLLGSARRRATRGVSGRSTRAERITALAFALVWIAVYVVQGALLHAGASKGIVYGIWPATAPLIVVGGAAAAYSAARQDWHELGPALVAVAVGAGAAYAGPRTVWLVVGIGLAAAVFLLGASRAWRSRRAPA